MPLVHRPAAGTLSDASTAGITAGAGRCIRPSPAGRRPPGQVPDCQAPASSAATAQARNRRRRPGLHPSPLVSRSIPQGGFQRGGIAVPPFASFQEGSGRETQGSRRKPTKCGGELPRRSKRGPSGGLRWERAEQRKERAGALWAAARGMEIVTTPPLPEFFFGGVEVYSFRMERIHLHRRRAFARLQPSRPPGRKSLCLRRRQSSHFTGWYSSPAPAPSQQRPLPSRPGPRWSSYRGDSW